MGKISLRIDGYLIETETGKSVLEAALEAGIYIPHLCYHPSLTPLGNCKLCCIEIEGEQRVIQACEKIVEAGMVVRTKTEAVKKRQMTALELMLASHPKDCTSCDKYLNCELQALLQYMGVAHSRLREIEKDNFRIAKSDNLIKREMQRCIQCGRCVRACEEYRGVGALAINKKGGETYIYTKDDQPLRETDCRFCGACVEVCPTGAIQDVKGIFPAHVPWQQAMIPCQNQCPAHTDIPLYVRLVNQGRYSDAVAVIREKLTFPHSLGLICTHVCESGCKRNHLNEGIAIKDLKRFAVEHDQEESWRKGIKRSAKNGKKVGIIGGGPAGMTAAYHLAKKGYETEVYERMPHPGGMLSYGIPKYRVPQDIVNKEIAILLEEGITVYPNSPIRQIDELQDKKYDAILIAVGACIGRRPPGFNQPWSNAIDGVEFCRMSCEGALPELGSVLTVYGGGNVGFDCARTAKKQGVETVRVICMEAREAMLADSEEISEALEEGIEILSGCSIVNITDAHGKITDLTLVRLHSFRFTAKGLELDVEEGSEQTLHTHTMVFATSQQPELDEAFGIELMNGTFARVDANQQTSQPGIFAAGDVTYGTKSVVQAIASGREAAGNIDKYLGGDGDMEEQLFKREERNPNIGRVDDFAHLDRVGCIGDSCAAKAESIRCLQCDLRLDIVKDRIWVDTHYKTVKGVKV